MKKRIIVLESGVKKEEITEKSCCPVNLVKITGE